MRSPGSKFALQGPRAVRLREGIGATVLALEIALAALLIFGPSFVDGIGRDERDLEERARWTEGVVVLREKPVNRPTSRRASATPLYAIRYRYTVNGRTYTGRTEVGAERIHSTRDDGPITVWYVPDRPEVSSVSRATFQNGSHRSQINRMALFLLAGILGFATVGVRALARKERRMLRNWPAVPATVIAVHETLRGRVIVREVELALQTDPPREVRIRMESSRWLAEGAETFAIHPPENPHELRLVPDLTFVEPAGKPISIF